uniref:Uncharacterized protein n=1 Tax=Plectus sambesii TaxID=2011161 RepID=A0A914WKV4_9BILA
MTTPTLQYSTDTFVTPLGAATAAEKTIVVQVPYTVPGNSQRLLKKLGLVIYLMQCALNSDQPVSFEMSKEITDFNSSFSLRFPASLMERSCQFLVAFEKLTTADCDSSIEMPTQPWLPLSFTLSCSAVRNAPCGTQVREPKCGLPFEEDAYWYESVKNDSSTSVRLFWLDDQKESQPLFYLVRYGPADVLHTTFLDVQGFPLNVVRLTGAIATLRACEKNCSKAIKSVVLPNVDPSRQYGAQICAVLDQSAATGMQPAAFASCCRIVTTA